MISVADVVPRLSLEQLLTLPSCFGLVTASPLQRAICRIIEGVPLGELAMHPHVLEDIGGEPIHKPRQVSIVAGIRGAKSLLCAVTAVHASQHCVIPDWIGPGEIPRISVVSLTVDLAHVIYRDHLLGKIQASPVLRTLVIGEPTSDTLTLRHPSGRPIEIRVVAGARAGSSLVARWSAGAIFDEAPRMHGQDEAIVNLDEMHRAVTGRLLENAQILNVGSPWAPMGPIYKQVQEHWKKPTDKLVVIRAPAPHLNPVLWTPQACQTLRETAPDAYATDIEVQFLAREAQLLEAAILDGATRTQHDIFIPRAHYVAACDPATRGNAWTVMVMSRDGDRRIIVAVKQWIGSSREPLDTRATMREVATFLKPYGVTDVWSDMWSFDAHRTIAREEGLQWHAPSQTDRENTERWLDIRAALIDKRLELHPDPVLRQDLQSIMRRVTQTGLTIHLPSSSDGRHCDYAPALARCWMQYIPDRRGVPLTPDQWAAKEEERMLERDLNPPKRPLR